ncbi:MAG TPA: 3-hydroxyacyl-CoA dehydrogenase NAD-binding domain-containing protein [Flavitalea sp.]|nr:3-hydroxyacyl-CoA dehydrogenase NAD-binding domain-containing protein [Flavitalea sp.]
MKEQFSICICGAGTMGSGIAQVFAQNDFNTILFDVNKDVLASAESKIRKYAPDAVNKISFTSLLTDCTASLVIEVIVEDEKIKAGLLNSIMAINSDETVFTTNTSSLAVTAIAEKISRPHQFAGMHFFNPAPVMKLVEIIRTKYTSDATIAFINEMTQAIGKTPVLCKDSPGFIVNRVARPYYLEALHLLENKIGDIDTIDRLMESSGFRMGPFKLMDLIGNDINYSVSCIVYDALGKPERLRPSIIQATKVKEGALGRKSGKGYYEYPGT